MTDKEIIEQEDAIMEEIEMSKAEMVKRVKTGYATFIEAMNIQKAKWTTINGFMQAKDSFMMVSDDYNPDKIRVLAQEMAEVIHFKVLVEFAIEDGITDEQLFDRVQELCAEYESILDTFYDPNIVDKEFEDFDYAYELLIMQVCQGVAEHWDRMSAFIEQATAEIMKSEAAIGELEEAAEE